jgi:hypothetical protein
VTDVRDRITLRGHSDLADELYRRVLGWPIPRPQTDADIVRDLRELVAERARRRRERQERLRP